MKNLKIIWLSDYKECDQCCGGFAQGFTAYLDGEFLDEFVPVARCFDSDTINEDDSYKRILKKLGFELEVE